MTSHERILHDTIIHLRETNMFLAHWKTDKGSKKILALVHELSKQLQVLAFSKPDPVHIRGKSSLMKQCTYTEHQGTFEVNFNVAGLDTAIQSVWRKFCIDASYQFCVWLLCTVHSMQNRTSEQTMEHCLKLEQALQHGDCKDWCYYLVQWLACLQGKFKSVHHHKIYWTLYAKVSWQIMSPTYLLLSTFSWASLFLWSVVRKASPC